MLISVFHQLSRPALEGLAEAISQQRIQLPCHPTVLASIIPTSLLQDVSTELNQLQSQGMKSEHLAYLLQLMAQERQQAQKQRSAVGLVWTGGEVPGTESRDTRVVVQELFGQAMKSVLISSYALDKGSKAQELFQPLAKRMEELPELQVRLFLNIKRPFGSTRESDATLLRKFAEEFRNEIWPSDRLPEVFYDPRSLSKLIAPRACLHAKCVVVDDLQLLVTSANFTEAAHQRNIEAGVVLSDAVAAKAMRVQFEMLVTRKVLCRLPGL